MAETSLYFLIALAATSTAEDRFRSTISPIGDVVNCTEFPSKTIFCRNSTAQAFFTDALAEDFAEIDDFTKDQLNALSWLGDNEYVLLNDTLLTRMSPATKDDRRQLLEKAGIVFDDLDELERFLAISDCNGLISATCDNYGDKDVDYKTYIIHYVPNGGTPSNGWAEYTQLVYSLSQAQLHRIWAKCESSNVARKKKLSLNHGLQTFNKLQYSKAEVWIKKQAICCGYGFCSYTNW